MQRYEGELEAQALSMEAMCFLLRTRAEAKHEDSPLPAHQVQRYEDELEAQALSMEAMSEERESARTNMQVRAGVCMCMVVGVCGCDLAHSQEPILKTFPFAKFTLNKPLSAASCPCLYTCFSSFSSPCPANPKRKDLFSVLF